VGWRCDCYRVDVALKQFIDVRNRNAAQRSRDKVRLLTVGICDSDQLGSRQSSKYTSMIAAHDADADDTDTQRTLRACYCSLHHLPILPQAPILQPFIA
jgi:hypothetical protein